MTADEIELQRKAHYASIFGNIADWLPPTGLLRWMGYASAAAVAFAAFGVLGWIGQVYRTMNRTAVMLLSPTAVRGVVLGIASGDRVLIPLGAFVFGVVASRFGAVEMLAAMAVANALAVAATWLVLLRDRRR